MIPALQSFAIPAYVDPAAFDIIEDLPVPQAKLARTSNSYPIPGDPNVATYDDVERYAKFLENEISSREAQKNELVNKMKQKLQAFYDLPWYIQILVGINGGPSWDVIALQAQITPLENEINILKNWHGQAKELLEKHTFDHNGTKCVRLNDTGTLLDPAVRKQWSLSNDWYKLTFYGSLPS